MIYMNKKYTSNGRPMRILCTDRDVADESVVTMDEDGTIYFFTAEGKYSEYGDSKNDLVEVWAPKEGELVWCWNAEDKMPNVRYYDKTTGTRFWMKDLCLRSDFWGYQYVAPFTGTLPEAFKGLA